MVACLDEFVATSSRAKSEAALASLYLKAIEDEGYQNAVFAKARNQRLTAIPWNHFPVGYSRNYIRAEWDKIDPIVQYVHSARRPCLWSDVCARSSLSDRQRTFLEDCRDIGVHSGLTIPLHGPGSDVDLISLSLRDQRRIAPERLPLLHALTVQYRFRLRELQGEPLKWCKEGKTNWEIGEIISISEKTVEFHLSNTIRKLGVSNRVTAVVKGIQLGIIPI